MRDFGNGLYLIKIAISYLCVVQLLQRKQYMFRQLWQYFCILLKINIVNNLNSKTINEHSLKINQLKLFQSYEMSVSISLDFEKRNFFVNLY